MEEEVYQYQRSRADWLKAGDKKTKFFHAKASSRRRKNKIEGIEDNAGNWFENRKDVEIRFCGYFQDLFTTSKSSMDQINATLESMAPKVSAKMNMFLEQAFTTEDIEATLNQMCPTKAPRPNGLQAFFFQNTGKMSKNE